MALSDFRTAKVPGTAGRLMTACQFRLAGTVLACGLFIPAQPASDFAKITNSRNNRHHQSGLSYAPGKAARSASQSLLTKTVSARSM